MMQKIRKLWASTAGNGEIVATVAAVAIAATLGYAAVKTVGGASQTSAGNSASKIQSF